MSMEIDCECPDERCQRDIFKQGRKQGALEELQKLERFLWKEPHNPFRMDYIKERIEELKGERGGLK